MHFLQSLSWPGIHLECGYGEQEYYSLERQCDDFSMHRKQSHFLPAGKNSTNFFYTYKPQSLQ